MVAKVTHLIDTEDTTAWVEQYDNDDKYLCIQDEDLEEDVMIELDLFKRVALKVKELFGE